MPKHEDYGTRFWLLIDANFDQDWQAAAEEWARRYEAGHDRLLQAMDDDGA